MCTKINSISNPNIVQMEACAACQAQNCCGHCWCCYGPWPTVARPAYFIPDHVIPREAWGLPAMVPAVKNTPWRGRRNT